MTEEKKSRSQMVREYLSSAAADQCGPTAVVNAFKEKGISISSQLVSQIKNGLKNKPTAKKGGVAVAKKSKNSSDMESWVIAKNLLNAVGGDLNLAKKNLEIVSRLMS
jgi:hypothetical protein